MKLMIRLPTFKKQSNLTASFQFREQQTLTAKHALYPNRSLLVYLITLLLYCFCLLTYKLLRNKHDRSSFALG